MTQEQEKKAEYIISMLKDNDNKALYIENILPPLMMQRLALAPILQAMVEDDLILITNTGVTQTISLKKDGWDFKSYKSKKRKDWYKKLPQNNWLLSEVIKYLVFAFIGGILGAISVMQCNHPAIPQPERKQSEQSIIKKG